MRVSVDRFQLVKRYPLTISRGTSAGSENVLVSVEVDGVVGIGEMAPTSGGDKPETAEEALRDLDRWAGALADLTPWETQRIEAILDRTDGGRAARAALDCALWDWRGKRLGLPVWKMLGLDLDRIPITSITLGINSPEVVRQRLPEMLSRTGACAVKVKLGSPAGAEADRDMLAAAQEAVAQPVRWRVDANGGWDVTTARNMIAWLAGRGIEFVEQPLLRGRELELPAVHKDSPLPIYVDESVRVAADVPRVAGCVDGVNLKLMKTGGITEALRLIATARAHGLRLMIGCMSESSLAITAAAHISPLVDALDLDSHLNLLPDPFQGAQCRDGRIVPSSAPGLGVDRV